MNASDVVNIFTEKLSKRHEIEGLPLHEYQVLTAISIDDFKNAVVSKIEEGFLLLSVVRVYYSQVPALIEILARFKKGEGITEERTNILGTFYSTDYRVVSIAFNFEEPQEWSSEGLTFVPFPMALPTETHLSIPGESDIQLIEFLEARRLSNFESLIGKDGQYIESLKSTNCESRTSCNSTSNRTSNFTTAPNNTPDTRTDTVTDDTYESRTDTNDEIDN